MVRAIQLWCRQLTEDWEWMDPWHHILRPWIHSPEVWGEQRCENWNTIINNNKVQAWPVEDWKTFFANPAVNEYLFQIKVG